MATISAVIMTLNEEHNIEYALRSVRPWCDEVVVVDMFSDDKTPEIARRYADQFLTHERVGFVEPARIMGFGAAKGDWIINIDADEVVAPKLGDWIRKFVDSDPPFDVVRIPRANVFLGRWIRSSPWWPGKTRLFRPGSIEVSTAIHHGLDPRPDARIKHLPKDPQLSMWHFSYLSMESLTAKTNRYTGIEARQAVEAGNRDPGLGELAWQPIRALLVYLAKFGPRDGMAGLVFAIDRAYYGFMAAAKRWDATRAPRRQGEYDRMREKLLSGYPDGGRKTKS